jgi:histidine triad (HIT) family protein
MEFAMFRHAPENYICPFCHLVQGVEDQHVFSVQSDIIYRDKSVTAFISSHQWPRNPGNTIIVPNKHYENIFDLPDAYAPEIQRVSRLISLAMKAVYSCEGISIRQHNEPAGYQDVWHYHVHVTPRYTDDRFYPTYAERSLIPAGERAIHAEKLKSGLAKLSKQSRK